MSRRWLLFAATVLVFAFAGPAGAAEPDPSPPGDGVELVLFYGEGCPYCARERDFLAELQERWPVLRVEEYEVWNDDANLERFRAVAAEHGVEVRAVPTTFLGGQAWVGFDDTVAGQMEDAVAALATGDTPESVERTTVDVPVFGTIDVGDRSLVAATLVIGFVDGVNPCSLWVLSMLLALVLHSGSRARILAVGALFLLVTSALYGLYMAGAYSALDHADEVAWIRVGAAAVAGTFGVLHLKEHVTPRGPSLTIPDRRKPTMYRRMRRLADPERSMPAVLAGTAALAVGVSLVETPCTAGLPLLWADLLAARDVAPAGAAVLFVLYLLVFLLDELVVFGAALVTLRATKLQEHHGRALQLVSGSLMLALALAMVVAPTLLETLRGTLVVFGGAVAVSAVVLTGETWWRHRHRRSPRAGALHP